MKVVYCLDSIGARGGSSTVIISKANALVQRGVSVWISFTERCEIPFLEVSSQLNLIDLEIRYSNNAWSFPWNLILLLFKQIKHRKALSSLLWKIHPDIVIAADNLNATVLPFIYRDWCLVREFHSALDFRRKSADSFLKRMVAIIAEKRDYRLLYRYDRYVVLTHEEKQLYWKEKDTVRVIPNPCPFSPAGRASLDEKRVISVGRLTVLKNQKALIHAFKKVIEKFPDWRLVIIGEGPEEINLRRLIDDEGLHDVVQLKGFTKVNQDDYLSSSIFCFSSISEGFGLVIVEAMCCGLPVVSYDCQFGPRDIISDGETGYLISVGDEEGLAEKIGLLIENKYLRKRIGAAAFEMAKKYSIERIMRQWMGLFDELLKEKKSK